ncbi:unnamed protein product [Arctogadus glacialis]
MAEGQSGASINKQEPFLLGAMHRGYGSGGPAIFIHLAARSSRSGGCDRGCSPGCPHWLAPPAQGSEGVDGDQPYAWGTRVLEPRCQPRLLPKSELMVPYASVYWVGPVWPHPKETALTPCPRY